jgi:hypothetical protein
VKTKLPAELWLGMVDGQWPVQTFVNEGHALYWAATPSIEETRRVWKVRLVDVTELRLVQVPDRFEAIPDDPR